LGELLTGKIIVYGTKWCGDCNRALKILKARKVDFDWIDIQNDSESAKLVEKINHGFRSVPTILFPDNTILVEPSNQALNEKLDLLAQ
jgi:mycoredoxin